MTLSANDTVALAKGLRLIARESGLRGAVASLDELIAGRDPSGGMISASAQLAALARQIGVPLESGPASASARKLARSEMYWRADDADYRIMLARTRAHGRGATAAEIQRSIAALEARS